MKDFGYDIEDFEDIDPTFGNLTDIKQLIDDAHKLGLKVILDLVPNHTSDKHKWFELSLNSTGKYKDYYIWAKPKDPNDTSTPPNNWVSVFNGSAWTYNNNRSEFYFHQFLKEQPDLNYRNKEVQNEMKNIIKYWLDYGMDGFRIDAVPHLFEHKDLSLDEICNYPCPDASLHANYVHNLTKDQPETYDLIKSWRDYVDDYANKNNKTEIVLLTEAYTYWDKTFKYYEFGADVPFNFKFITDANAKSNATQFKGIIDRWINGMPKNDSVANWVMGNHDRVRVATRYPNRAEHLIMLEMILPGVAVTYYGEEIGMLDYEGLHILDPTRDGCRTPFQWDNSTNAGFSKANETWLPVHPGYKTLNLKQQINDPGSFYHMYIELITLRHTSVLTKGSVLTEALNNDKVLLVQRTNGNESVTLLLNFVANDEKVDLTKYIKYRTTEIFVSSVGSNYTKGYTVGNINTFAIPKEKAVVLRSYNKQAKSQANAAGFSIMTVLLLLFISLLRS